MGIAQSPFSRLAVRLCASVGGLRSLLLLPFLFLGGCGMVDAKKALRAGLYVEKFRSTREKIERTWALTGMWEQREVSEPRPSRDIVVAVDERQNHAAFPGICKTKQGALLVVYREGRAHVDNAGRVMLVRSTDGGKTWGAPELVFDDPSYDDRNAAITALSDGRVAVVFDTYNQGEDRYSYFLISEDEGRTWSKPQQIGESRYYRTRSPMLELSPTRWLFPVYDCSGPAEGRGSFCEIYDPKKEKFTRAVITQKRGLTDETCLVSLGGNKVLALIRHEGDASVPPYHHASFSKDGGATWSEPAPTDIPAVRSPCDALRLPSGDVACAFSFVNRRSERMVLSHDGGKTWDIENSVEVFHGHKAIGGDRAYAAVTLLDPETLGTVLYETLPHPKGGRIYFVKTLLSEFGRVRTEALCSQAGGASMALLPGLYGDYRIDIRYRFLGRFGKPPCTVRLFGNLNSLEDCLQLSFAIAPLIYKGASNVVELALLSPGQEKKALVAREAVPEWLDDGQIHALTLEKRSNTVSGALDGHEQFRLQIPPLKLGAIGFGSDQAAVAMYSCTVSRPE